MLEDRVSNSYVFKFCRRSARSSGLHKLSECLGQVVDPISIGEDSRLGNHSYAWKLLGLVYIGWDPRLYNKLLVGYVILKLTFFILFWFLTLLLYVLVSTSNYEIWPSPSEYSVCATGT